MLAALPYWLVNQWEEWYNFHKLIGPDGADPEFRLDYALAKGFSTLANHWREKEALGYKDLLVFPPPVPAQTPEQLRAALEGKASQQKRQAGRRNRQKEETPNDVSPNTSTHHKVGLRSRRRSQGSDRGVQEHQRGEQVDRAGGQSGEQVQ